MSFLTAVLKFDLYLKFQGKILMIFYLNLKISHVHFSQPPQKNVLYLTSNCTPIIARDERKAQAMGLPITCHDIINLPMDEFNDLLSKHELTEEQLTLCRDIRRRGKNKVNKKSRLFQDFMIFRILILFFIFTIVLHLNSVMQ